MYFLLNFQKRSTQKKCFSSVRAPTRQHQTEPSWRKLYQRQIIFLVAFSVDLFQIVGLDFVVLVDLAEDRCRCFSTPANQGPSRLA